MIYQLPFDSTGSASVTVNLLDSEYTFRTYFVTGQRDSWLLDITNASGELLVAGVKLVAGCKSVIKGMSKPLASIELFVVLNIASPELPENWLGSTLTVYWLTDSSDSVLQLADPLEDVSYVFGE